MKKLIFAALAVTASVASFSVNLYSNQSSNVNFAQLNAASTAANGATPPSGGFWSEVQSQAGIINTSAGSTVTGAFRLADDFTVTGGGWNVSGFKVYAYQTGSTGNPFSGGTMNIWSAAGPAGGGSIIGTATYGGATDTIATASGNGNIFRIFNSNPGVSVPGTTRRVWEVTFNFNQVLSAGTYWIDYGLVAANAGTAFNPSSTHQGLRGPLGANALQLNGTWAQIVDTSTLGAGSGNDVNQDLPFIVTGEAVPEPATMAILGAGALALIRRRRKSA